MDSTEQDSASLSPQEAMRGPSMILSADNIDGLVELYLVSRDSIPPDCIKAEVILLNVYSVL